MAYTAKVAVNRRKIPLYQHENGNVLIALFITNFSDEIYICTRNKEKKFWFIWWNSKYLNSLLEKDTHDWIFRKKTCPTYPVKMSPLLMY